MTVHRQPETDLLTEASPLLSLGGVHLSPNIQDGYLLSLGAPTVAGTPLRDGTKRWLPWFDGYEGGLWNRFRFESHETRGDTQVLHTTALCDNDYPFRERRDSSGDLCLSNTHWDTPALEARFDICFQPSRVEIEGYSFTGFKYWFEYSGEAFIHRILDRQTWELGGNLDDVTLCLRNWLTPPRLKIGREDSYSTVGLDDWARLLPGNLWARWSLLPSFDFQYGQAGTLLGWFDEVSLIRSVVETNTGENCLRVMDLHAFEQSRHFQTNAKTILFCPDVLDETDALNLWTRIHDMESERARHQYELPEEEAPALIFSHNAWNNIRFNKTYENTLEIAAEFDADYMFIDPVWEHQQAWRESLEEAVPVEKQKGTIFDKWQHESMCCTLDFEVANIHGGEVELKKLCERANAKGVKVMSWMATHLSPNSIWMTEENLATKESGRHPDTGYAAACWPLRTGSPAWNRMREQLLGVCERTGLQGYLWDSFSNLAWWHLEYASSTLAPQLPDVMALYRDLEAAGLYIMPEAVVSFSSHSCCGLHGGDIYGDELLGYSYGTNISLPDGMEKAMLCGEIPVDMLFRCVAHKRISNLNYHYVPREEWDETNVEKIKEIFRLYKTQRDKMHKRTVLRDGKGVVWESKKGEKTLFSFKAQSIEGEAVDLQSGEAVKDGRLEAHRAYALS